MLLTDIAQRLSSDAPSIPSDEQSKTQRIEAEYDRLSKEHVRAKLELERLRDQERYKTTELQHDSSIETTKQFTPAPHGLETLSGKIIPFDSGPPGWLEYVEDKFYQVIWRWHYTLKFDEQPHGLTAFCPECDNQLQGYKYVDGRTGGYVIHLVCDFHRSISHECHDDDFVHIKKLIRQRIEDGSWDAIVTRQRMHRRY